MTSTIDSPAHDAAARATVGAALRRMAAALAAAGIDTPALDARLLAGAVLGLDQVQLLREPERLLAARERDALEAATARRMRREPVSRIVGRRWFCGLELEIGPETLDPRPETETLVDGVLACLRETDGGERAPLRILDLGTGTGAILIALLTALPSATGLGTDISEGALEIARRNAARHAVADRSAFRNANWLEGVEDRECFDVIVSNPPYIASGAIAALDPEVASYDPARALDGGEDGLQAYRRILARVARHLAPGGLLVLEVGADQAQAVAQMCADTGRLVLEASDVWCDLGGHVRCVAARSHGAEEPKKVLGFGKRSG